VEGTDIDNMPIADLPGKGGVTTFYIDLTAQAASSADADEYNCTANFL
jgi:hypothetical protein